MKRRKKVRLYRKIDSDLITLYRHPDFSLREAMIRSLQMCAAGEVKYIRLPKPYILHDIPKKVEIAIDLPDDPKLDAWFRSIPMGNRNDAIKCIVRGYLSGPVVSSYTRNTDEDNTAGFNSGEKQMISCRKTKKEVIQEKKEEMKRIKQIMQQDGISAENMLAILEKEKRGELEESLRAVSDDSPKPVKKQEKPTGKPVNVKPAEKPVSEKPADTADGPPETAILEETGANDLVKTENPAKGPEEDGDFDLFGAVNSMMEDL